LLNEDALLDDHKAFDTMRLWVVQSNDIADLKVSGNHLVHRQAAMYDASLGSPCDNRYRRKDVTRRLDGSGRDTVDIGYPSRSPAGAQMRP
jgi:hypothetical protein